jgi:hypothetical protein
MEITQEILDKFNLENNTKHTIEGWERSKNDYRNIIN